MHKQPDGSGSRANKRRIIVSVLVLSVLAVIIVAMFHYMYDSARKSILNTWENNVIQLARNTEYTLVHSVDAVNLSSYDIEKMIADGSSNDEIRDYLIREKNGYASIVDNNYTGVYGYVRSEYVDGGVWDPPQAQLPGSVRQCARSYR